MSKVIGEEKITMPTWTAIQKMTAEEVAKWKLLSMLLIHQRLEDLVADGRMRDLTHKTEAAMANARRKGF